MPHPLHTLPPPPLPTSLWLVMDKMCMFFYKYNIKKTIIEKHINHIIGLDQIKETSSLNKTHNYIGRNCMNQFSQNVNIKTFVPDMKILCKVDQDIVQFEATHQLSYCVMMTILFSCIYLSSSSWLKIIWQQ